MERHYVEICIYNANLGEFDYITREVSERDPKKIGYTESEMIFVRKKVLMGYRYFDKTEELVNGEEIIGERENVTGWTYFREAVDNCKTKYECSIEIKKGDRII